MRVCCCYSKTRVPTTSYRSGYSVTATRAPNARRRRTRGMHCARRADGRRRSVLRAQGRRAGLARLLTRDEICAKAPRRVYDRLGGSCSCCMIGTYLYNIVDANKRNSLFSFTDSLAAVRRDLSSCTIVYICMGVR